jgi:putative membrane protein
MTTVRTLGALGALCLLAGVAGFVSAEEKNLTTDEALAKAMDCNIFEKQMAEKAVKKADSEDVKNYARELVKDHRKLNKRLEELAKEKKVAVVSGSTKEQKEQMAELSKASGSDFDKKYIDMMVENHTRALKHMKRCIKEGNDEQLRSLAEQALPIMQKHLDEAKAIQKKLARS